MNRALFVKAVSDSKLLLGALLVFLLGFAWLHFWVQSMISLPAFTEFLANALPQRWERLSGVPFSQVATSAGRVAITFIHPLVFFAAVVWAIGRGSDCVSGEIGRGTMELLLAQPVPRLAVYATQALATILGAALLAGAVWCGTAIGLATVALPDPVAATLFIPPTVNLFGLMVCLGGMTALMSSWDSQRWRTVGLMGALYAVSLVLKIIGRMSDSWHWVSYGSFLTPYEPQVLVARYSEAWSLLAYQDGAVVGLGLGGQQLVLIGVGLLCYVAGAIVFNRRELPAPL